MVLSVQNQAFARKLGGNCSIGGAKYGRCGRIDLLDKSGLAPVSSSAGAYVCPQSTELAHITGWGESCMIPAGAIDPSDTTCITTPNLIGEVIDTITTVGIGIDMRANFCSVGAGDSHMEGALISNSFFDQCKDLPVIQRKKCQARLLRGINSDGSHMTSYNSLQQYTTSDLCQALPNLERPVVDSNNQFVFYNGKQAFCPVMRCNIPTDTMISKYYDRVHQRTAIMAVFGGAIGALISELTGDCSDLVELGDGSSAGVAMWDIVRLKGEIQGDQICTKMLFPTGYTTLACKPRSIPETSYAGTNNCYVNNSSCVTGESHSKGFFKFTARMMECVNDLISNLFRTPPDLACPKNPLAAFQDSLKDIVRVMMILYVIIFGIRIAIGGALPKKSEFFTFILKFALVIYFAIGGVPGTDNKTGIEQVYDISITAMSSFANMVAGNDDLGIGPDGAPKQSPKLCQFNLADYDEGYEYLAIWDSLDCRLAFYLGIASPVEGGALAAMTSNILNAAVFVLIWGAMFSFIFPLLVFMIAFGVFLLSIVIYFVHVYIIAMIAVAITIFMGPIFIPMALFEKTKGYFDEWLKLLIAYTLYPAIIMAFVGVMVITFDNIIYKGCDFIPDQNIPGIDFNYWKFAPNSTDECKSSFGYITAQLSSGHLSEIADFAGGLFKYIRIKKDVSLLGDLIESMMLCTFFAFLFYYFAMQLSGFAADVSQATNIGAQAIGPTALIDIALDVATKGYASKVKNELKSEDDKSKDGDNGISVSKSKSARKGIDVSSKK